VGEYGIAIQLPGASKSETEEVKKKMVALLTFMEQDEEGNWVPAKGKANGEELTLTSRYFRENTYVNVDQFGWPLLIFEWNETGQKLSEQITGRLVGKQLAIYLGDEPLLGEDGLPIAPVVKTVISESGQIEGLSFTDAEELSDLLNAGRIPVPLGCWEGEGDSRVFKPNVPLYERSVDATLGQDSIKKSLLAAEIGIALLLLFMLLYYRLPGLIACLSLGIYGVFLLAIFDLANITLTLPGIAGFILSLGMAVDANVLIFERMKEELRAGRTLGAAVEAGFNRAWTAIRDSNITTFIACAVLLWFGTKLGAFMVSGFAITLFIGVALSMFSAIIITRTFLRLIVGGRLVTTPSAYGVGK
jgi:preprotein translocase subunit SecD